MLPALFIGHGSPTNAILDNDFTKSLSHIAKQFEKPKAIVVISAHWLTNGTLVNSAVIPEQMYDFYGFPEELYRLKYTCHGSPTAANLIVDRIKLCAIKLDNKRGMDHAAWAILIHMFPNADIPVVELSIDFSQNLEFHYKLGEELKDLRSQGILFIGSGNLIHNLRHMENAIDSVPHDWAKQADLQLKDLIANNDIQALITMDGFSKETRTGIPSLEHYIPLLYALGMKNENETIRFFYEGFQYGSVSMRSFIIQ